MVEIAHMLILGRRPKSAELETCLAQGLGWRALRQRILSSPEARRQTEKAAAERPLLFLHIPKTAGTTLGELLRAAHPSAPWLHGLAVARKLREMDPSERGALRFIQGHVPHSLGQELPAPPAYLTVLRMPGPRLLSYFEYIRRAPDHPEHDLARDHSFGAYLEASAERPIRPWLDNTQIRMIGGDMGPDGIGEETAIFAQAVAHLSAPGMRFGFSEDFDAFQRALVADGLLPRVSTRRFNVAPYPADLGQALAALTSAQRDLFDSYIRWDSWFYDMAFRIRQARDGF